jgi:hypothetical protein
VGIILEHTGRKAAAKSLTASISSRKAKMRIANHFHIAIFEETQGPSINLDHPASTVG